MSGAHLLPDACTTCGCHMMRPFEYNCGAVHGDFCLNCGRRIGAEPGRLTEVDLRCERGATPHDHPPSETADRIKAWHDKLNAMSGAELLAWTESKKEMDETTKDRFRKEAARRAR